MKLYILPLIIFGVFLLSFCSTSKVELNREKNEAAKEEISKEEVFESPLNLSFQQSAAWINLMPGDTPKFHVSGECLLKEDPEYDFNKLELENIKVLQSGEEIYTIKPKVRYETVGNHIKINFFTVRGLSLSPVLQKDKPVNFEMIFSDGSENISYFLDNIKIEEAH